MIVLIYLVLTVGVAYLLYREKAKRDRSAIDAPVGTYSVFIDTERLANNDFTRLKAFFRESRAAFILARC